MRALGVPGERRDRLAAIPAHQNFRAVLEPHHQHRAVAIARGHDGLLRMAGDHGDARLQRRQHRRLLAHRTVLAVERPEDHGVGARGGEDACRPRSTTSSGRGRDSRDMRMCLLSASRQPCSAGSCMAVTRNLLSGLKVTARCEPVHSRISGFAAMLGNHSVTPL